MRDSIKGFAWFMIIEFTLIAFVLLLMGAFVIDPVSGANVPLELVSDIAASIGTSVNAIGVGVFVLGTFVNLMVMFFIAARRT